MSLSVVVVLHDSAAVLPALLASLDAHLPADAQVIVVDTASADDGAQLAERWGAELVALGANPGFGAANNAGVERARHPVTVLLNPDCTLLDAATLPGLAGTATARRALVAPRLVLPDGRPQDSAHPLPGTVGALLAAPVPPRALPGPVRDRVRPWRAERPRSVGWAIAACLAARTELLRELGPFDPSQFLFFEDLDLCLRARAAGAPTLLRPDLAVGHQGGHSTRTAYAAEPHALLAARRHAVVRASRGRVGAGLDDVAQAATFLTRWAGRALAGRPAGRPRAQLVAQLRRRR